MIFQYNEHEHLRQVNLYKKYEHDAGWDIRTPYGFTMWPGQSKVVDTGLHIFIPEGLMGVIQSRSGFSLDHGIEAGNAGVIDSGFRKECKVRLYASYNLERGYRFDPGDRIAQIVFGLSHTVKGWAMVKLQWKLFRQGIPMKIPERPLAAWPDIGRGANGYGSTGKH